MKNFAAALILSWGLVIAAPGNLITFDLLGNDAFATLDGQTSGTVTNNGLRAWISASEGELNRTGSGFGINGPGDDDTDALNIDQYIDIVFEQDINFRNVNVSSWGTGSAAEIRRGPTFETLGNISGTGDTAFNIAVTAGKTLRIYATGETASNNGFSLDSFTVETIPEPMVFSFISLCGIGTLVVRRFVD